MEKDLDSKLYAEYFEGKKDVFDLLYNKYKRKIEFFIFNIVKDYQKAEDIAQDTFIYAFQNKSKEVYSFKNYLYFIAKSRAISYMKNEKNREYITEKYFNKTETIEKDILEFITNQETKNQLIESINELNDKYKNAVYLTQIEELSYKEVSEILGESVQNIKNFVHRGKKELKKILIKKKLDEMNKLLKVLIIIVSVTTILTGITYASVTIYKKVWKEPIELKNIQEYHEQDSKEQSAKKEKMNSTEAVPIDTIVTLGQDIFDNLGYEYNIKASDVITISESTDYYYRINFDNILLTFSQEGNFVSFFDNKLFYDFTINTEFISEQEAKEIACSLFEDIKIGINGEYIFDKVSMISAVSPNKQCKVWLAHFYQKCDNELINYYNSIDMDFRVVNNEILINSILVRNSDYIYEENELIINKEQAIEIAKKCDRKISVLDIENIESEVAIRDMNSFVYVQENTLGVEDEIRHEEQEDGRILIYNGYYNEKNLRKVWNIKISYIVEKEKQKNFNEVNGRNYYVDVTTGEIIGGAWGDNDDRIKW